MLIKINDKNEIVEMAIYGSLENGFEFEGSIPDDFEANFKPSYYLLQDDQIIVNPNYQEPTIEVPSGPTEQDRINAQLLKSTAQNAAANAAIVKQLATIASAGTDTEEAK